MPFVSSANAVEPPSRNAADRSIVLSSTLAPARNTNAAAGMTRLSLLTVDPMNASCGIASGTSAASTPTAGGHLS